MEYVVIEQEFSPFYARRLGLKMGSQGVLMQSVSNIIAKMYQLFVQKDLDLIEINPLAVSSCGQVMALNGQVKVNERAINRHPEIAEMAATMVKSSQLQPRNINHILADDNSLEMRGKIGILGNGTGSVLTTLDAVFNAGGKPGQSLNLRHSFLTDTQVTTFGDRLEQGLQFLTAAENIEVILINFLGTIPDVEKMSKIIENFLNLEPEKIGSVLYNGNGSNSLKLPKLVMRSAGSDFNQVREYLESKTTENQNLIVVEDLESAVKKAVEITNPQAVVKSKTASKSQGTTTRKTRTQTRRSKPTSKKNSRIINNRRISINS